MSIPYKSCYFKYINVSSCSNSNTLIPLQWDNATFSLCHYIIKFLHLYI